MRIAILSFDLRGLWLAVIVVVSFILYRIIYNVFLHPLRGIPGPFVAKLSRLHLLGTFLRGEQHFEQIELHQKYGPIVRIAPNLVIVNDTAYFPMYSNWGKATFWRAFRPHPDILSHAIIEDTELHKSMKKLVMPAYQMSAVIKNEPRMDKHIATLTTRLRERSGKIVDFAPWTQYAALDIVMEMVFSNPMGFLDQAKDVNGVIANIHGLIVGAMIPAIFPFLTKLIHHPWLFPYIAPKPTDLSGPGYIHGLAYKQVRNRFKDLQDSTVKFSDILQNIIDKPGNETMTPEILEQESVNPILAGSDSVGAHLRAVVLYVATNPRVLTKLLNEIDAADEQGLLSDIPQFDEVKKHIPYIELVHKEALRIYPITGGYLPREVTKGGATVCGYFLPEGTNVGFQQWAVSRNPKIFGDDCEIFRPERWENPSSTSNAERRDGESPEKMNGNLNDEKDTAAEARKLRDSGNIFFMTGPMACTGRNIAQLEIYKVTAQLFRKFDIQIVNPTRPWKDVNKLGMMHWDFWVIFTEREKTRMRNNATVKS